MSILLSNSIQPVKIYAEAEGSLPDLVETGRGERGEGRGGGGGVDRSACPESRGPYTIPCNNPHQPTWSKGTMCNIIITLYSSMEV